MSSPEVWLRGPLPGVPPLLQPVAHALLQAGEEIRRAMADFPDELLWERPAGVASVGFHLQHIVGVLDRLFTYARGEQLDEGQLARLRAEGRVPEVGGSAEALVAEVGRAIDRAVEALKEIDPATLTEPREVGRGRLPSTVHPRLPALPCPSSRAPSACSCCPISS
jgi:hypothetical protein